MKNEDKTKEQLTNELKEMRQRIAELEASETKRKRVEEALYESEEKYRQLVENLNEVLYTTDRNARVTYISPNIEKISGYQPNDILGHSFLEFVYPDDLSGRIEQFQKVLSGVDLVTEYRYVTKDRGIKWVRTNARPVVIEGEVTGIQGMLVDITEHKEAEESIRESEEKYRAILDSIEDGYFEVDLPGNFTFFNNALCELLKYSKDELIGMNYREYTDEKNAKILYKAANKVYTTGKPLSLTNYKVIAKDGTVRILETPVHLVKDSNGKPTGFRGLARDITHRKQAEEALRENEEKYRNLIERANDGIAIIQDNIVKYVNPRLADMWGGKIEEVIGTPFTDYVHPDDLAKVVDLYKQRMKGKEDITQIYEASLKRKDGSKAYAELNTGIITYEGKPANLVIVRDITDRKRAEEEIRLHSEIMKNMIEGVILTRVSDGTITYTNPKFEVMFGYGPGELIGKQISVVNAPTEKSPEELAVDIQRTLEKTGVWSGEVYNIKKDGTTFWCFANVSTFEHPAYGKVWIAVHTDTTEHKQAEDALRESEEKYRTILGSIEEGYYEVDIKGNLTFFNDSLCKILGYSRDEIIGMNNRKYMDEENARKVYEGFNKVFKAGMPSKVLDWELTKKDGTKRFVEISVSLIRDSEGNPTGFRGVLRDVTERKQAEEALKESEERFRILTEKSPLGISLIGKDGYYKYINPKFVEMFGYTLKDIPTGREWFRKAYPDKEYRHQVISKWITDIEGYKNGELRPQVFDITCKDGSKKTIHFRPATIGTGDQFIIYEDITERKQAEAELIQTKNFLQNIFDSSIDGMTTTDLHGNIIYASPRAKNISGYEPEEIIGKKIYSLYENGKEDAKTIMKELTSKGELKEHEMKLIRKNGILMNINLSASLLRNEKGDVIGTLGIYRDITEKKKLETQIQYAQRMESIGTLAGGTAHNFNNLLMGIQGNVSLMLSEIDSHHPSHERLTNIEKMVKSGSKLTSQLLGYARGGKYEVRPISLNQLVKETSDTFDTTRKDIRVHQDLDKDLFGILADQGQIEQVLLNLYVNAADAMPGGGELFLKTINTSHKYMKGKPYRVRPGSYALLTVADTGIGMDKKTEEHIFDPFFTTKGLARGTGLGLASVYGIIKAHGGYIDVESKKGHGTTFYVYLPATEAEDIAKRAEAERGAEILKGRETVLIVDDEETILDVGKELLKTLGYKVLIAEGGKEAIEIYDANKGTIDLVILDMIMPDMGGGETYDRLKEINPEIKVLLSSGYSIDGQATEILKRGCSGFIQKPFTMKELSQSIREVLEKG